MSEQPVLPYAGTSGHSGTDTSEQRAREQDTGGRTRRTQRWVVKMAEIAGPEGVTIRELREHPTAKSQGWHHGNVSGALSALHKVGTLNRLRERRDRCAVYVLPTHREWRDIEPHGRVVPVHKTGLPEEPAVVTEMRKAVQNYGHRHQTLFRQEILGLLEYIDTLKGEQ